MKDYAPQRRMQTLLTIDPDAREAEALLRTTVPDEPQHLFVGDATEYPSERLSIDGIAARITHAPWVRMLCVLAEDNCEWGPHVEYVGTLISVVLLNGRIFQREVYARLIREGDYSDQAFGCWPVESLDEHPQARVVIAAWEAHFGRRFDDTLIVAWPNWGGQAKPAFIPHATLKTFLRLAAWLYFDSAPAPWLFRREPLCRATKLVPDDPEARILDAVEARLRAGEVLAPSERADLGLDDDTWWTSKLLHLASHRCPRLAEVYWRVLAAREPSPIEARPPFFLHEAYQDGDAIAARLAKAEADPESGWLDQSGLDQPVLIAEKRTWLARLGCVELARWFEAMLTLDADLRALGRPGVSPASPVRWSFFARSPLPDEPASRRRALAAALAAFEAMPAPAPPTCRPEERAHDFEHEGAAWRLYFDEFREVDVEFNGAWELKLARCEDASTDSRRSARRSTPRPR